MASLFGGPDIAEALAPAWAGGVYYAAQRRSATATEKAAPGSLGVFYFSRWKSAEAARTFAKVYEGSFARKYSGLKERKEDETEGETVYTTDEGDVLMWVSGKDLFIGEGYPVATARKLKDSVEAVQGAGPMRMAVTPTRELGLSGAQAIAGFGVMKAAIVSSK
jgi:hypothetical protein